MGPNLEGGYRCVRFTKLQPKTKESHLAVGGWPSVSFKNFKKKKKKKREKMNYHI